MSGPHGLGREGERLAALHLEGKGWRILERNFRSGHKEIDLIVARGRVVAFVEVKTRRGAGWGHPLEAITRKKRGEIAQVARAWLGSPSARAPHLGSGTLLRFDAIAVSMVSGRAPHIEHLEDAWRLG